VRTADTWSRISTDLQRCAAPAGRTLVVAALAAVLQTAAAQGFEVVPWPAGKPSPALAGTNLQGQRLDLRELRGRPVLVNFWASWCEPCTAELPSLQAVAQRHGSDALVVLAVNFKEAPATVERFVQRTSMALPVLLDTSGQTARAWGVNIFPTTLLIQADGRVQAVVRGALDWSSPQGDALLQPLLTNPK